MEQVKSKFSTAKSYSDSEYTKDRAGEALKHGKG